MCPAIHTISRILLRPSSTYEPSDPPLRIFSNIFISIFYTLSMSVCIKKTSFEKLVSKARTILTKVSHANIDKLTLIERVT